MLHKRLFKHWPKKSLCFFLHEGKTRQMLLASLLRSAAVSAFCFTLQIYSRTSSSLPGVLKSVLSWQRGSKYSKQKSIMRNTNRHYEGKWCIVSIWPGSHTGGWIQLQIFYFFYFQASVRVTLEWALWQTLKPISSRAERTSHGHNGSYYLHSGVITVAADNENIQRNDWLQSRLERLPFLLSG